MSNFNRILFISSSRGLVLGTLVSGVMLGLRMQGREDIEWSDRSWRLLTNTGQVEVDNWILGGIAMGATAAFLASRTGRLPAGIENRMATALVGGAGLGTTAGTAGYMLWRYGVKGGEFV
jgi:hypothetical protein